MRIDHIGFWASDLESVRAFSETCFGAIAGAKSTNPAKGFESYSLSFQGNDVRLELMRVSGLVVRPLGGPAVGYTHLAIAVRLEEAAERLFQESVVDTEK